MLILVIFSAGVVWTLAGREYVEVQTFDVHVTAEKEMIEQKFKAHKEHTDLKFKHTDEQIEHVNEHLEEQKETLEEIKDYLMDR